MSPEAKGPAPPGDRPSENQAATKPLDNESLPLTAHDDATALCQAYAVLLITPTGHYRRRIFLSLHSATEAVKRARNKGQPVRLVLVELTPVQADLGIDGEWTHD